MTLPFCTSTVAGGCANLHSVSGLEHLFRWNSRHTSSCSQRESLPFSRLFMFTMVAIVGTGFRGGRSARSYAVRVRRIGGGGRARPRALSMHCCWRTLHADTPLTLLHTRETNTRSRRYTVQKYADKINLTSKLIKDTDVASLFRRVLNNYYHTRSYRC